MYVEESISFGSGAKARKSLEKLDLGLGSILVSKTFRVKKWKHTIHKFQKLVAKTS